MVNKIDDFDDLTDQQEDVESNVLQVLKKPKSKENKPDTPYEKFAISDVVDQAIWDGLNESTKNNITAVVLAKHRPDGIDSDLWSELSHTDKIHIINCKISIDYECQHPDEIHFSTWSTFSPGTKNEIKGKLYKSRPPGFDSNLWDGLSDMTKQHIAKDMLRYSNRSNLEKEDEYRKSTFACLPWKVYNWITREAPGGDLCTKKMYLRWWIQRISFKSRVLTFFFSGAHIIEDPDSGIGAMVLVCALILTIPFGTFSFLNDAYFTALQLSLDECDNGLSYSERSFTTIHNLITKSIAACIFFSMMGLILSSVYYVFKPLPGRELERWCMNQGRILIASLFLVTALDIAGLMALGLCLLEFSSVQLVNICTYDVGPLFNPGIYGVVTSFVVAVVCML